MKVRLDLRKWPDRLHYSFSASRLGSDEHGHWFGCRSPTTFTGPDGPGTWRRAFVLLVPESDWWIATFYAAEAPAIEPGDVVLPDGLEVYVDVTTIPRFEPDRLVTVDLDLDVVRLSDGRVELWDQDEFDEHRVRFGYPPDVVEHAERTAAELIEAVERRREPFGEASAPYLAALWSPGFVR